jgi:hypothetical protein
MDKQVLEDQLERLDEEYPLVLHTDVGRTFSTVRRMQVEKKMGIPISGAVRNAVGIRCGAFSGNMKVSFQAARSIG